MSVIACLVLLEMDLYVKVKIDGTFECSCVEGYILDGYDNGACYGQCHIIVTTICSFLL